MGRVLYPVAQKLGDARCEGLNSSSWIYWLYDQGTVGLGEEVRVAFSEAMMAIIDYSAISGIQAELIDM